MNTRQASKPTALAAVSTPSMRSTGAAIWQNETKAGLRYGVTFSRLYRTEDGKWANSTTFDRQDLLAEMSAVADEVFSEHEQRVPPLNERIWKIDCEIRKLVLEQVLLHELRLQEKTRNRGMLPTYFELAFGSSSDASDPSSTDDYLKLHRNNDPESETALVRGQIDRVDVGEPGSNAIAYDYKLSQGARIIDMEAGRQLQIPIYLAALEQLFLPSFEFAGGGYYRLRGRGRRLNQGLYRRMFSDCTDVSSYTVTDLGTRTSSTSGRSARRSNARASSISAGTISGVQSAGAFGNSLTQCAPAIFASGPRRERRRASSVIIPLFAVTIVIESIGSEINFAISKR